MKSHRSYTDHEIARYVLGVEMPGQARDIQASLAHDDASAARALKWEAYLLSIVDALPPSPPPYELLEQIRATLGMADLVANADPVPGEACALRDAGASREAAGAGRPRRRLNRKRLLVGIGIGVLLAALAALVIQASLRPIRPGTQVQQVIPLQGGGAKAPGPGH
jgi:hypothetical protein